MRLNPLTRHTSECRRVHYRPVDRSASPISRFAILIPPVAEARTTDRDERSSRWTQADPKPS
jgi:hypothetical protein